MTDFSRYDIRIFSKDDSPEGFEASWLELFVVCYETNISKGKEVFQKYRYNKAWFCGVFSERDSLVACYSGVEVDCAIGKLLVSTDTMSNGVFKNATKYMADALYLHLGQCGVDAVCGFPNDNIRAIRQKKLGWSMSGELFCWVGIPLVATHEMGAMSRGMWQIKRPTSGLFIGKRTGLLRLIRIVTRGANYGSIFGIPFTLAAYRPGLFFCKVPSFIVKPKTFGFKTLRNHDQLTAAFLDASKRLDIDTIDLP